jgi:formiminotetrahydrofolate cyclodeaminase
MSERVDQATQPLFAFVADVAAKSPAPGGGAVAAVAGALAAALAAMTCAFTQGKKKYVAVEPEVVAAIVQLQEWIDRLRALMDADAEAFVALTPFLKLNAEERAGRADVRAAVDAAIAVPAEVGGIAVDLLRKTARLVEITNPLLISDLGIAGALAHATATAARFNVLVNLPLLDDPSAAAEWRVKMTEMMHLADRLWEEIRRGVDRHLV